MQSILDWMKGIVILFVVLSALIHLVPREQYKKYVRFFAELVLVIAVIAPVAKVIYRSGDLDELIHYSQFWQEMENQKKDMEKLEFTGEDAYRKEYEKAIGADITQMAEDKGYPVKSVLVTLNNAYELTQVDLTIGEKQKEDQVLVERISLYPSTDNTVSPQMAELQKTICDFYRLDEKQLVIRMG